MTSPTAENQSTDQKPNNTVQENLGKMRQFYEKQLEQERAARLEAERKAQELQSFRNNQPEDEDEDDEVYVPKKKLDKKLAKFGEENRQYTQSEIQKAVNLALEDERKQNWLRANGDFEEVLQHADKFAERDPELAETILKMPNTFERQKLVYKTIKSMGIHKPESKQPSIQDKIDANRRSPYYQPSGVGTSPYSANHSDFSPTGQKSAYDKMQQLKNQLRI